MRKSSALDALFPRTRQAILAATLLHPERWWYLSDLANYMQVSPSSLQRELASLVAAGILRFRRDGNRAYYQSEPTCPFLPELQGLLAKTVGIADVLKETLSSFESKVEIAFVYGSVAREEERSASDIDLMILGIVGLRELTPALREAEQRLQRQVNPSLYTKEEFARKVEEGNHFLHTVLNASKIFLKGSEHELEAISRGAEGKDAYHEFQ